MGVIEQFLLRTPVIYPREFWVHWLTECCVFYNTLDTSPTVNLKSIPLQKSSDCHKSHNLEINYLSWWTLQQKVKESFLNDLLIMYPYGCAHTLALVSTGTRCLWCSQRYLEVRAIVDFSTWLLGGQLWDVRAIWLQHLSPWLSGLIPLMWLARQALPPSPTVLHVSLPKWHAFPKHSGIYLLESLNKASRSL